MKFDSAQWREERNDMLYKWFDGDHNAVTFALDMFEIAEVWDDLVDGDTVPGDRLNSMFVRAMFDLPRNPFYRVHLDTLQPIMLAGINAWLDSTVLEKREDQWSRIWAYALRDFYMELVPAIAAIIGGFDHMRAVSLEAREFFQKETLEEYLDDLPV